MSAPLPPDSTPPDPGPPDAPADRTDLRAAIEHPHSCDACGPNGVADGVCDECGRGRRPGRDRIEESFARVAAVTERGLVRPRNEDAYGVVRVPGGVVAVVCDGVASVPGGAEASLVACEAALECAASAGVDLADVTPTVPGEDPDDESDGEDSGDDPHEDSDEGPADGPEPDPVADLAAACADAARSAVVALHERVGGKPPACTYVSAVVTPGDVVVAWAGDSRVYWLDEEGGSRVLSADDSWAAEMVAAGLRTPEEAWADRRAHVITRWMAADAPDRPAHRVRVRPDRPGLLLLCSDGLWNHIPDPDALAALVAPRAGSDTVPDDLRPPARALVAAALAEGGHDNVTVVLVAAGPRD